ncbi:DUF6113 family protein [Streptomyces sp. NPDC002004]
MMSTEDKGTPGGRPRASSGPAPGNGAGVGTGFGGGSGQRPLTPGRIAAYVGLFVLGAVVAVAGALVQGGLFPGGLLLALAAAAGTFVGGARATGARAGAIAPAAGWMLTVVLLTTSRPEGDFAFGVGVGSYLFLLGGMAIAVICATLGQPPHQGPPSARLGK